jgi:hypothetical protein
MILKSVLLEYGFTCDINSIAQEENLLLWWKTRIIKLVT